MPLYEYRCEQCERLTERIQKFSDPELTVCPHCGGVLARTVTAPAVHFSGGGWYKDLYSSAKPAAASAGESAGASGDSAGKTSEGAGAKASEGSGSGDSGASSGSNPAPGTASSAAPTPAAAPAASSKP